MSNDNLKGIFAPISTPFKDDQTIDTDALSFNMERYAASGINGYLALGSNGENKSLTFDEKREVLKTIVKRKNESQIIMAGCIAESNKETIELVKMSEDEGADYITLLPPSYFKKQMTEDVLLKYFSDIADNANKPCLIYNAPQYSAGISLSTSLMVKLSKHENIVGMKDSLGSNINSYLLFMPEDFKIIAGSANFLISALETGACGGIISFANYLPEVACNLFRLYTEKKYSEYIDLNKKILKISAVISGSGGVSAVKAAMDITGFKGGYPRLPLLPLDNEGKNQIKNELKEIRL